MTGWHATDSLWSFQRKFVGLWAVDSATPPVMGRIGGNRVSSGVSHIIHVHKLKYSMIYASSTVWANPLDALAKNASSTNLLNLFESKFWKHHTSLSYLVVANMLLFSPLLGEDSHFDSYFSNGLKPQARYILKRSSSKVFGRSSSAMIPSSGIVQMFLKLGWKIQKSGDRQLRER